MDFFYLDLSNPRDDSNQIVNQGRLLSSDLEDPAALFNEIAALGRLDMVGAIRSTMAYADQQGLQFMSADEARMTFSTWPLLRARVASRNADSLAGAALAIAARR